MPTPKLNSIDDYQLFLDETIETWSQEQRTAFAAAMAERWLPVYEAFSKAEEWGDPASFRRALDAVWRHVSGQPLGRADRARYAQQIDDTTPHMDDFDAPEALAACVMVKEAVECCRPSDNHNYVIQASLSGFEAVLPDWEIEIEEQPRLWKKGVVRNELRKQLKLIEEIRATTHFNDATIAMLREKLATASFVGEETPSTEPESRWGIPTRPRSSSTGAWSRPTSVATSAHR
jgi:uncharacterized protein YjaG (DUF416 family)